MAGERKTTQIILSAVLLFGIGLLVLSAFYPSSSIAILGMVIVSLGAIFLYIKPVKHVPLTLLNSSAEVAVSNIERLITDLNLTERGIYLPPKNLKKETSLVFISENSENLSCSSSRMLHADEKKGILVTPPGAALSRLFEKELGFPFANANVNQFQNKLQKVVVDDLGLAESAEIKVDGNRITIEIVGSMLDEVCRQTDFQPKTHMQVGCLLSSSFACILAKITERPVTIINETRIEETKKTLIEFQIFDKETIQYENMSLTPLICTDSGLNSGEDKGVITRLKTLDFEPPSFSRRQISINLYGSDGSDSLEIELVSCALDRFKKSGDLFVLIDLKDPQYSYSKIKGYVFDDDLSIKFEKFVEICRTSSVSQKTMNFIETEFTTKIFGLTLGEQVGHSLASYVERSGFSDIDDWIKASTQEDKIPECVAGNKLLYLYHIQAITSSILQPIHKQAVQ